MFIDLFTNLRLHPTRPTQHCVLRYAGHVRRTLGSNGPGACLHCRLHGTRDASEADSSSDGRVRSGKSVYSTLLLISARNDDPSILRRFRERSYKMNG